MELAGPRPGRVHMAFGEEAVVTADWMSLRGQEPPAPAGIDVSVPHSARIWNYWLGGKDNFAVDRAVGEQVKAMFPGIALVARVQREFLVRAVSYLAGPAGIRQFLDIGTGLPSADNTHQVAQRVAPACRIIYVDNDPIVLVHARALLTSDPEGATAYVEADLRDPARIMSAAAQTLDLTQPVALMLLGILGHIGSDEEAASVAKALLGDLAPGSYLVVADGVNTDQAGNEAQDRYNQQSPVAYHLRSPARLAAFFDGLRFVEPGMVPCAQWRPDAHAGIEPPEAAVYCGVAVKP
jgi:O-methyltransferase involved in polyketide biosynthesis